MKKKIVMLGSFVVDLTSRQVGHPKPGETIMGQSFKMGPGGKGSNQAVACFRAGADVTLVTKVGNDVFGKVATDFYEKEGMDTSYVLHDPEKETGVALIEVDTESAENAIVVVPAACNGFTDEDIESLRPLIEKADILLMQLEINLSAIEKATQIAKKNGVTIVLNPAPAQPVSDELLSQMDYVTPNEHEAETITGVKVASLESARAAAKVLHDKGVKNVVITLGSMGSYASDGKTDRLLPPLPVSAIDSTGAGDAFNGGFTMALSEGHDLFTALQYGNVCGALCVTKLGTAPAMPYRTEIDEFYKQNYGK